MPTTTLQKTSSLSSLEQSEDGLKNTIDYLQRAKRKWAIRTFLGCIAFILVCSVALAIQAEETPLVSEKKIESFERPNVLSNLEK